MTKAEFLQAYPQFTARAAFVDGALSEAALFVGELWGDKAPLGLGLYAAHKLVWDAVTGSDPVTAFDADLLIVGKTVGRLSVTRSAELLRLTWDQSFNCTKYGRRYLELQRFVGIGAVCA